MLTCPSDRATYYGLSMNKMFDYMASGRPTISNIQTQNDILADNRCGVTIAPGNAKEMADTILHFCNMDASEYESYCRNAKETVKKYDFDVLINELENILKGVLKEA